MQYRIAGSWSGPTIFKLTSVFILWNTDLHHIWEFWYIRCAVISLTYFWRFRKQVLSIIWTRNIWYLSVAEEWWIVSWYTTEFAKFMATHILTWFSNENEESWKFISAAYSQITCNSIHLSFIQYGLLYF